MSDIVRSGTTTSKVRTAIHIGMVFRENLAEAAGRTMAVFEVLPAGVLLYNALDFSKDREVLATFPELHLTDFPHNTGWTVLRLLEPDASLELCLDMEVRLGRGGPGSLSWRSPDGILIDLDAFGIGWSISAITACGIGLSIQEGTRDDAIGCFGKVLRKLRDKVRRGDNV